MNIERETTGPSIGEAMMHINAIEQQIQVMGGNDSEMETLKDIRKQLKDQKITPVDGVHKAQKLLEGKQDYH